MLIVFFILLKKKKDLNTRLAAVANPRRIYIHNLEEFKTPAHYSTCFKHSGLPLNVLKVPFGRFGASNTRYNNLKYILLFYTPADDQND